MPVRRPVGGEPRHNTATLQHQRRLTVRLLCDAAMNRNMVIPQPHREIANIDSAIRRNQTAN
jgi:hypothetical protein